jgi:hypothetical protein
MEKVMVHLSLYEHCRSSFVADAIQRIKLGRSGGQWTHITETQGQGDELQQANLITYTA